MSKSLLCLICLAACLAACHHTSTPTDVKLMPSTFITNERAINSQCANIDLKHGQRAVFYVDLPQPSSLKVSYDLIITPTFNGQLHAPTGDIIALASLDYRNRTTTTKPLENQGNYQLTALESKNIQLCVVPTNWTVQ